MKSEGKAIDRVSRKRRAGLLLHPTSFPGEADHGDIGHQAYRFIEFLNTNGFKVWQMLPLGPTHDDKSPYQCLSSHAGNPLLISLDWLVDRAWLDKSKINIIEDDKNYRLACLQQAAHYFHEKNDSAWKEKINKFTNDNAYWLDDFVLFMALKSRYMNQPWYEWPEALRHREKNALAEAREELEAIIKQNVFEQFVFFTQWQEIREYARRYNVEMFGDVPIFVAKDSADVWAKRENFLMDKDGCMDVVAGVPPDAFSETGQRWGNPLFDWEYMQASGFAWWKERFKTQLSLFDMVRLDHFRGLEACWQIPEKEETAKNGKWVEVPGREMLRELFATIEHLPLVAEDLGVITDPVIKLKNDFNLPGMKVLQFAFDGNNANPHLPHCHEPGDVVYTGTHDNDTSLGWYRDDSNYNSRYFEDYTGQKYSTDKKAVLELIRLAFSSVSYLSIIPMQDILMLDSSARMNMPGTVGDNWKWRFKWNQLRQEIIDEVLYFMKLYQR